MSAQQPAGEPLLVVIDRTARTVDGESVRIARDVLCAGARVKLCLPETPEEMERALARRGRRRPVVVGDDRALLAAVRTLHRLRELQQDALALVPVGPHQALALSRTLGVPQDAVAAARAALAGEERNLDLLQDDSGGIVVGALRIPGGGRVPAPAVPVEADRYDRYDRDPAEAGGSGRGEAGAGRTDGLSDRARDGWWSPVGRTARTVARSLGAPLLSLSGLVGAVGPGSPGSGGVLPQHRGHRLRVEADGVLLADLDRPVRQVSLSNARPVPDDGLVEVTVRYPSSSLRTDAEQEADGGRGASPTRVRARAVTVSGRDFHYRADTVVAGPVRSRTWTVQPGAWRLTLPRAS
ncbi:hypothetical protein [Streptomyces sp. HB2AG]|uniref:hypothetical protein n=1 Tax=Streptomyces sp. HB2AG TaxID=2983400 RepID=UPI0022AAB74D|nr:hypothetical protein [Streptomyces sp. HB2AG]MCZ2523797.1 hypothetical protein [Streptomyces sp. HB2AG]